MRISVTKMSLGNHKMMNTMKIHFIAIGGSIMHNLAIALSRNGHTVTGSDDVIYGISHDKLSAEGLLPAEFGWYPESITEDIDLIILGMHAKIDNPELLKAQELGIKIQSFPAFIASHSQEKRRIIVAGSHGKTTTTSMLMHILKAAKQDYDYLVGAQLADFDLMVQLSDAPLIVIEGDEYLSSAIDRRPKFVHYNPHITIITGIAWDHANVFPTADDYKLQFDTLLNALEDGASVYYDANDPELVDLVNQYAGRLSVTGYLGLDGVGSSVTKDGSEYTMNIFGQHNRKNMHAALLVARELGIEMEKGLQSMQSFQGAAMRQQVIKETSPRIYRDFGHAPSKVRATIEAVVENHRDARIGVLVELHSYSSMLADFIPQYAGVFDHVEAAAVCVDAHAFKIKKMPVLKSEEIQSAFASADCKVIFDKDDLQQLIEDWQQYDVLLLLSSGNLMGVEVVQLPN